MNPENAIASEPTLPESAPRAAATLLTKKQTSASLLANGLAVKAKWRTLIGEAHAEWNKVSAQELSTVEGSVHVLAGLVQLRQRLSRDESDAQVKAFFAKHQLTLARS